MTENEVIKALECCSSNVTGNEYCKDCPYNFTEYCGEESAKDTLDLINRQKAEIKRLQSMNQAKLDTIHDLMTEVERSRNALMGECMLSNCSREDEIKVEAYKEIIEKLKEHLCSYDLPDYHSFRAVDEDTIDEVLKEMVGE